MALSKLILVLKAVLALTVQSAPIEQSASAVASETSHGIPASEECAQW